MVSSPMNLRKKSLALGSTVTLAGGATGASLLAVLMAAASPMKRAAHPDEMVGPALLLASDAGSFITGQCILADGGMVPH